MNTGAPRKVQTYNVQGHSAGIVGTVAGPLCPCPSGKSLESPVHKTGTEGGTRGDEGNKSLSGRTGSGVRVADRERRTRVRNIDDWFGTVGGETVSRGRTHRH